jgi:hypothetical protein
MQDTSHAGRYRGDTRSERRLGHCSWGYVSYPRVPFYSKVHQPSEIVVNEGAEYGSLGVRRPNTDVFEQWH